MPLVPFSKKNYNEFISRTEDNFDVLLEKINLFHKQTRLDIGIGKKARRNINERFDYNNELKDVQINQKGITTEEVSSEFNDILQGTIRHQDPKTAFNLIPSPMLDIVAALTLVNLYNPNTCWDFISGKFCLYEKKIVRMLGQLVDWPEADGFVVTGGKQALAYAIKNGMAKASLNFPAEMSDYVVICSELAHYSIEHVCHYLGISQENCLRVAATPSGEMDSRVLEETLIRAVSQGKRIAAVIAVGGATVNLVPDNILSVKQTIDHISKECKLNYIPYLHVDSVISWAWLAFAKSPDKAWQNEVSPRVIQKIEHVLSKLSGIQYADSFAADFHKTGFCPYAAGVFIAKEPGNLIGMTLDGATSKENIRFGEAEIYRQSLENSRSGLAIASIWIALRRMGLDGFRNYIIYQLEVCELFKKKIREKYSSHFEVINEHTNGWEIVLKPHFSERLSWDQLQKSSPEEKKEYSKKCNLFLSSLWYDPLDNNQQCQVPVIGFVKSYSNKGSHQQSFPAFLIHPTSLHYDNDTIEEMLDGIIKTKIDFENHSEDNKSKFDETYLTQFVPPR